ncbi:MAG: hypothetical protein JNL01_15805 [Bdellovibrionales bacterium]|nr:hypothetical protein [Bdellovibrionales bacterium]
MIFFSFSDQSGMATRRKIMQLIFLSWGVSGWAVSGSAFADPALMAVPQGFDQVQEAIESLAADPSCAVEDGKNGKKVPGQPKPSLPGGIIQCEKSNSPLFAMDSILDLTIQANFENLQGWAEQGLDDQALWAKAEKGTLSYGSGSDQKKIKIGLVTRGKSRNDHCQFKPLKVLLPEDKDLARTIFDPLKGNELKLVVHCDYRSGTLEQHPAANQNVIKEYSAYKMLKAAGYPVPEVRLLRMKYLKPDGSQQATGYGIFIEPKSSLGKRCACGHDKASIAKMEPSKKMGFLFAENLIAGTDWSPESGHNAIALECGGKAEGIAPYDFNDSGLIDARNEKYSNQAMKNKEFFERIEKGPYDRMAVEDWGSGGIDFDVKMTAADQKNWDATLVEEVRRIYSHKAKLMTELDRSPFKDKKAFKDHFDQFYSELEKFAAKKSIDLKGIQQVAPEPSSATMTIVLANYLNRDVTEWVRAQFKKEGRLTGCGYFREEDGVSMLDPNLLVVIQCVNLQGKKIEKTIQLNCIYQDPWRTISCD